jgi:hypothetical protein
MRAETITVRRRKVYLAFLTLALSFILGLVLVTQASQRAQAAATKAQRTACILGDLVTVSLTGPRPPKLTAQQRVMLQHFEAAQRVLKREKCARIVHEILNG